MHTPHPISNHPTPTQQSISMQRRCSNLSALSNQQQHPFNSIQEEREFSTERMSETSFDSMDNTGNVLQQVPVPTEDARRLSQLTKARSSQLENLVRRLSFQEMSMINDHVNNNPDNNPNNSNTTASASAAQQQQYKSTAHNIRQSLLTLMTTQATATQAVNTNRASLCSGTINGRGSFNVTGAMDRQRRFSMHDSLENVLQNSKRLLSFFEFLKQKECSELLEFWSIVELYQNLYWKPFKLLGINLKIQVKVSNPEDSSTTESVAQVAGTENKKKINSTLALVLSDFTIHKEEILRNEIIEYYITDNAPSQICLPSQMRTNILKIATPRTMSKETTSRESRLSLFRNAQKECYDELQRIHIPLFQQYEEEEEQAKRKNQKKQDGQQHVAAESEVGQGGDGQRSGSIYALPAHSPAIASMTSSMLAADVLLERRSTSSAQLPVYRTGEKQVTLNKWGW